MKVLITGRTGQIGRALLASAPPACEIVAPNRSELDLADLDSIRRAVALHSPDLIVNAGAYTAVDDAEREPALAHEINAVAPECLAESAASCGARMIQLSTDFVFNGAAAIPYSPDTAPEPLSVYGATKLAGENAVLGQLPELGIVLRTAWVYSATGQNFLLTILRRLRKTGSVRVVDDQTGAPTAAASVADIVWALARKPATHGIYHWTDAGAATWCEFARAIADEASALGLVDRSVDVIPITTRDYPTAAMRPKYSLLDTRSTTALTGIVPRDWRARLKDVLKEVAVD
jgi:dTDP-4-dehydrorhamnose reductase